MRLTKVPSSLVMVALVAALALFGSLFELVQANGGLGWDGVFYANPPQLSPYYINRIVPITLARLFPFDAVTNWRLLNACSCAASAVLWASIADQLELKGGKWLGFCGIFLTFQAKQFYFDPVLVDATAEFAAMLLLFLHLRRAHLLLFFATVVASFCWPTAGLSGAALLAFTERKHERALKGLVPLAAITVVSVIAYAVFWLLRSPVRSFVTAIPSYAVLAFAAWPLIDRYRPRLILPALVALAPIAAAVMLARGSAGGSPSAIIGYMFRPQSGMFFLPVVGLAVYYGPVFVLACLNWRKVAAAARELGITLPILINLPFALTTEPREFLFAWPFIVAAVAAGLDSFSWRIAALAAAWSQFWLPINIAPWTPGTADVIKFPKQLWFMHFGFWMSPLMFAVNAALVIATALVLKSEPLRPSAKSTPR